MKPTNRDIVERYISAYNRRDTDAMLELFAEDALFESVSNTGGIARTENREQLRELALQTVDWFAERRQSVTGWVDGGDEVAVEISFWCRLADYM
ncbi:MAG: nuclear transport factor 2 family protein [Thermodesulfobacteriota bacterium]